MGIMVLKKIDADFPMHFKNWIEHDSPKSMKLTHSTKDIVDILMQNEILQ